MAKLTPRRKPQFLWQAVWILLPMAVLAVIGLISLRKDRLFAEQEARESGKVLAERLAQAISVEAARQLGDYREASFNLHSIRMAELGQLKMGGAQTETVRQRVESWQRANPDIDLGTWPPTDGLGDRETNFTFVNGITTQPEATQLQPPAWLGQLTRRQEQLWLSAKQLEWMSRDSPEAQNALRQFIQTKPPDDARANAEYLLLLAKMQGPGASAEFFNRSPLADSLRLTETGLPVGQLIRYQALRLTPSGAGVPEQLVRSIGRLLHYQSSIFSPRLVAEVERVADGTSSAANAAVLISWWEADEAGRRVLDDFREQYPTNVWSAQPFWINSDAGKFLLLLGDRQSPSTDPASPVRYWYLLFPQAVVEKALAMAVKKEDITLPPYARAEFALAGKKIVLSNNGAVFTNASLAVLGQAAGEWEHIVPWIPSYSFQVTAFLANPKILYARQSQRTLLFGSLIVVSTLAALMGLLAAWRSFQHQQQLSELKTNFVSSVSHELRAPIAAVRLMAENLERGKIPDTPRQNEYFRFIVQECRRLSSLIENVLDFSRIEQGRKQYEFEETDLSALAQTTVKLMEPYAAEKGVSLKLEADVAGIESSVDGRALQQALVNLIDNAVKHSAKGETVAVGLHRQNDFIHLSVTDHGPGIPRGEQEKIFERFYRLGSELRRETQGVGIGLSVVQHIVEAHGGRVALESEIGKGSRFTIELPAKR